ncbi:hypothetical protein BH23BAC2_BH23BAC2_23820 [soil metagenome]
MDLPAEKYQLIEWLISLEDESIIKRLQEIKRDTLDSRKSYKISDPEKLFIQTGVKDIEEGRIYSHEEIIREVKEKFNL